MAKVELVSAWAKDSILMGAVTQAMLWDMGFAKGQELSKAQLKKVRTEANKILRSIGGKTIDDEYILDILE